MKLVAGFPAIIGVLLLLYIFTFGEIWNNHSVQSYMVLCTGIICLCLGFLGIALTGTQKQ